MLRVWSDVLMAADTRQVTLLCLLYLSADFVASATTYCRHQGRRTGMDLLVPDRSYTANCIWRSVVDAVSTAVWCPPRIGSGTTTDGLYTIYTADLTYVVERHSICLHQYADDSQVHVSVPSVT